MSEISFSIIVPVYNAADFIESNIKAFYDKSVECSESFELILIDDCSEDGSYEILQSLEGEYTEIKALKTESNSGPGIARNAGIKAAQGKWILFLDCDDFFVSEFLNKIAEFISKPQNYNSDIICFDWKYNESSKHMPNTSFSGRTDKDSLKRNKDEIIRDYLKLQIDNSVIYSAFSREFLIDNNIQFEAGLHEDVYFMFKSYWHAESITLMDKVLYLKTSRRYSIVNTISDKHIAGFFKAYESIKNLLKESDHFKKYEEEYMQGLIAVIATRAREIVRNESYTKKQAALYETIFDCWNNISPSADTELSYNYTLYSMICKKFLEVMSDASLSSQEKTTTITEFIKDSGNKRWSCRDLHHSAFLRPDEINTCCKRFFVDNEMKGDVTIIKNENINLSGQMTEQLFEAKKNLFMDINRGNKTECDGCPYLTFDEWPSFEETKITTLSFEHHSICNLRCTYCSDLYWGGKKPIYDVFAFVQELMNQGRLADNATIIWGGGEPTVEKNFAKTINSIVDALPNARHRVITNSVKYSEVVAKLLKQDKVTIYTSVDAGTPEIYKSVRGFDRFYRSLENTRKYAEANAHNVTVKYIFTKGNILEEQVRAFAQIVNDYSLNDCTFQISFDFKEEFVSIDALVLMILMYDLLKKQNVRLVFFDELIHQRLMDLDNTEISEFYEKLEEIGIKDALADPQDYPEVIVYGAGEQARLLLQHSIFFKSSRVAFFVDSTPEKQGKKYFDRNIFLPEKILESELPVLIAATQNYTPIYEQFISIGASEDRLIKKLTM
jgi:glycosyltransferase involved in cell wall biosynthesis/uncharacterized Fe-S cluster-containing radical SAM superfamily protein